VLVGALLPVCAVPGAVPGEDCFPESVAGVSLPTGAVPGADCGAGCAAGALDGVPDDPADCAPVAVTISSAIAANITGLKLFKLVLMTLPPTRPVDCAASLQSLDASILLLGIAGEEIFRSCVESLARSHQLPAPKVTMPARIYSSLRIAQSSWRLSPSELKWEAHSSREGSCAGMP